MVHIAKHGSLALQIVQFSFGMPMVYRPHPLHMLTCLGCARMLDLDAGNRSPSHEVHTATATYIALSGVPSSMFAILATRAEEQVGYVL